MLFSLFAQAFEPVTDLIEPFVFRLESAAQQPMPIALPDEPPTLQLALIGIATLVAYSLVGRLWRRPVGLAENRTETDASADTRSTSREAA